MTAAAWSPEPHRPVADEGWVLDAEALAEFDSPAAIRAALLPEQVADFDAAYDAGLTAARQTLRLDELHRFLRTWRRIALMTKQDPDQQRKILAVAAEIQRTGQPRPGSVTWDALRAELDL